MYFKMLRNILYLAKDCDVTEIQIFHMLHKPVKLKWRNKSSSVAIHHSLLKRHTESVTHSLY